MARTGRPTILTEDLIANAWNYLEDTVSVDAYNLLPTIEGLALHLHCARETLYQWEKENSDFSDILETLRSAQAQKLIQNGITNRYNSVMAKLMLSKHGYIETKDVTSGGEKISAVVPATSDEINRELRQILGQPKAEADSAIQSGESVKSQD